jgi:type VI secretion system protein ImpG
MNKQYYINALNAIKRDAKGFAKQYPNVAPLLAKESTDPDVERLLEGFAYLSAQLDERIDNTNTRIANSIIQQFYPNYYRANTAATMLELNLEPDNSTGTLIPAGTAFYGYSSNNRKCKFINGQDEVILPLTVSSTSFNDNEDGSSAIEIKLAFNSGASRNANYTRLLFYLDMSVDGAQQVILLLNKYIKNIRCFYAGDEYILDKSNCVTSVQQQNNWRDFFVFPQVFNQFSIRQLTFLKQREPVGYFTIRINLTKLPKWFELDEPLNIITNAIVVRNEYHTDATPINLTNSAIEYPVRLENEQASILKVDAVTLVNRISLAAYNCPSILHAYNGNSDTVAYELNCRPNPAYHKVDYYLTLFGNLSPVNYQVVPEVTVTDGAVAANIGANKVIHQDSDSPFNLSFRNCHATSRYYSVNTNYRRLWQKVSEITHALTEEFSIERLKQSMLDSVSSLQGINDEIIHRMLDSITSATLEPSEYNYRGFVVAGYELFIEASLSGFISLGQLFVFFNIMNQELINQLKPNQFLVMYVNVDELSEPLFWSPRTVDKILNHEQ